MMSFLEALAMRKEDSVDDLAHFSLDVVEAQVDGHVQSFLAHPPMQC